MYIVSVSLIRKNVSWDINKVNSNQICGSRSHCYVGYPPVGQFLWCPLFLLWRLPWICFNLPHQVDDIFFRDALQVLIHSCRSLYQCSVSVTVHKRKVNLLVSNMSRPICLSSPPQMLALSTSVQSIWPTLKMQEGRGPYSARTQWLHRWLWWEAHTLHCLHWSSWTT